MFDAYIGGHEKDALSPPSEEGKRVNGGHRAPSCANRLERKRGSNLNRRPQAAHLSGGPVCVTRHGVFGRCRSRTGPVRCRPSHAPFLRRVSLRGAPALGALLSCACRRLFSVCIHRRHPCGCCPPLVPLFSTLICSHHGSAGLAFVGKAVPRAVWCRRSDWCASIYAHVFVATLLRIRGA